MAPQENNESTSSSIISHGSDSDARNLVGCTSVASNKRSDRLGKRQHAELASPAWESEECPMCHSRCHLL
jgi:hypothetical protein